METQVYSYVTWGNKAKNTPSKRLAVWAKDYDADLVFYTRESGDSNAKFEEVVRTRIDHEKFSWIARGLFRKAAQTIPRGRYNTKDITETKVVCDYGFVTADYHVIRITSVVKPTGDGKTTNMTKLGVYKAKDWTEINEFRAKRKGSNLNYPEEKKVFSMDINTFPIADNSFIPEDVCVLEDLDEIFFSMFLKPGSYNSFLDRVHASEKNSNDSNETISSSGDDRSTSSDSPSVDDDEDEFPF